jgi:hypothetical protein
MDRNQAFRKRLDIKLNKGGFDPTPYVDIIMERIDYEDVEDIQEFMDDVLTNPSFDFIFGKSSLMNATQKAKTSEQLMHRIAAVQDFDPEPHVLILMDLYGTPEFNKYVEFDEDDDEELNFHPYFDKHNLTSEQRDVIFERFIDLQSDKLGIHGRGRNPNTVTKGEAIVGFFLILIFTVLPSFFIPNFLQRNGWLPADTGWFLKIVVGIFSFFVLMFILNKVMSALQRKT